jgi:signal transduction histidine kinase
MVRALRKDTPFLIVSGSIGEEAAVRLLKDGASDFVVKTNLARLGPAVERSLEEAEIRRERDQALAALTQALQARDEFLSIAAHELKTPLTSLLLQAQGLMKAVLPENLQSLDRVKAASTIESVERSAKRLNGLVDQLLEINRVTNDRILLSREAVDLVHVVHEVIARTTELAAAAKVSLQVKAPVSLVGQWDHDRLMMVVTNLLSNAIKYGANHPVEITVSAEGERARLEVKDGGIGISADDQQRIFGRFERAVPSRHYGGFGLGLWISRKVVEAHGGTIQVNSRPGQGAGFTVVLPLRAPEPA